MVIQVCVGSSCHLRGSAEIVELLETYIKQHNLDDDVALVGCFCLGTCNRVGVSVQIDDEVHCGVTKENFKEFFTEKILNKLK